MSKGSHYPGDECQWPGNWHGKHGKGAMRTHRENKRTAAKILSGAPLATEKPKRRRRKRTNRKVSNGK